MLPIEFEYHTLRTTTELDMNFQSPQREILSQLNSLDEYRSNLLSHMAQRVKGSSNSLSGVLTTHNTPLTISPSLLGKSGFAVSRNSRARSRAHQNSEAQAPMVKGQWPCSYRGFPYREIGECDAALHLRHLCSTRS
jgi:hypothetical protein